MPRRTAAARLATPFLTFSVTDRSRVTMSTSSVWQACSGQSQHLSTDSSLLHCQFIVFGSSRSGAWQACTGQSQRLSTDTNLLYCLLVGLEMSTSGAWQACRGQSQHSSTLTPFTTFSLSSCRPALDTVST